MKSICITGATLEDLSAVARVLEKAGMAPSGPTTRGNALDMAYWHDQVVAAAGEASGSRGRITSPGLFGEQLASDIFLANASVPVWGWSDERSVWLLDFWFAFQPCLYFLLVCVSPEDMLARAMETEAGVASLPASLAVWQAQHDALLRFYHRHPDRALLVSARDCASAPQALVDLCVTRWGVPLTAVDAPQPIPAADPLARYLARQFCREYPQLASLAHAVEATLLRFGAAEGLGSAAPLPPEAVIAGFRNLRDRSAERRQIETLQALADARQEQVLAAARVREEQDACIARLQSQLDGGRRELADMADRLDVLAETEARLQATEEKLQTANQDGEQFLLHGQRMKEELEAISAEYENSKERLEVLETEKVGLLQEYEALKVNFSDIATACEGHQQRADACQTELDSARRELAALANRLEVLARTEVRLKDSEEKLQIARQEGEQLLLQLHQVQEELESIFLQYEDVKKQVTALQVEKSGLIQEFERLQSSSSDIAKAYDEQKLYNEDIAAQLQAALQVKEEYERLKSSFADISRSYDEQKIYNEDVTIQLQGALQLQEEHERLKSSFADIVKSHDEQKLCNEDITAQLQGALQLQEEHERLKSSFADIVKSHDEQKLYNEDITAQLQGALQAKEEQEHRVTQLQAQLDTLDQELSAATSRVEVLALAEIQLRHTEETLNDTLGEREDLLSRYNTVQEALQQAQRQVREADARWRRMWQRNPDYSDYESVSIAPGTESATPSLRCRFQGLELAGRRLPQCDVQVVLEDGVAGFRVIRGPEDTAPLVRWPLPAKGEQDVTIIPVAQPGNEQQRLEIFFDLSASDWRFFPSLARLLSNILPASPEVQGVSEAQRREFLAGLANFLALVSNFPAVLRYDRVALKQEQCHPTYEHLCLRLENLGLGEQLWPVFEFRLSCAEIRPDSFGMYPKLEFPEDAGQSPFEDWFEESCDELGPKLELRFALPWDMDTDVWGRLSPQDKFFVAALIQRLPAMLHGLQESGVPIGRAWNDWIQMAGEVQRILALHLAHAQ